MTELSEENEKAAAQAMTDMAEDLRKKSDSFNYWKCLECEGEPQFEHPEMMKHLQEVHNIDTKNTKAKRNMLMHLDGKNWYQSNYEIEIDGKKFVNLVRNKRAKNDMMRF